MSSSEPITHDDVSLLAHTVQNLNAEIAAKTALTEHLHEYIDQLKTHDFPELLQSVQSMKSLFAKIAQNTEYDVTANNVLPRISGVLEAIHNKVTAMDARNDNESMSSFAESFIMDPDGRSGSDNGSVYSEANSEANSDNDSDMTFDD